MRQSWLLPSSLNRSPQISVEEEADLSIHCQLPFNLGGLVLTRGLPKPIRAGLTLPLSVVLVELDPVADAAEPTLIPASAGMQAIRVAYSYKDDPGIDGIFMASEGRE